MSDPALSRPPANDPLDTQVVELSRRKTLGRLLIIAAVVVAGLGMRPFLGDGPWQQSWLGHNGARYSQIARNYVRLGPFHLAGAPLLNGAQEPLPDVYANHPPGVSWLVAGSFAIFGESELAARNVAGFSALLALILLALLVAGESDLVTGGLAALLAAAMPMTMVYGGHVDPQGAPVLALSLAVLLAYRRGLAGRGYALWLVATILATAMDWWGFYACAGSAIHLFLSRPDRRREACCLAGWTTLLFGGWVAWIVNLPGKSFSGLFEAAGVRGPALLLQGSEGLGRGVAEWFSAAWSLMPGWPVWLLLAGVVCLSPRLRRSNSGLLGIPGLLALLLLPPLNHAAIFPQGLLVHSYWLFGLPVGLAAAIAFALRPLTLRNPGPPVALAAGAALAALALVPGAALLPDPPTEIPALLGELLGEATSPGELILTNYDCNPLLPGGQGDAYLSKRLEVSYASDRRVRGLDLERLSDVEAFHEARARCPDARWFLLMPFPNEPSEDLKEALAQASGDEPILVYEEPAVWLFGLRH